MTTRDHPTRQLLGRTALRLFVARGVTATTIRDIAKAARVAEGTLYRHWPSKDELAWDLFSTNFVGLAGALEAVQAQHPRSRDKLAAMIAHVCRLFEQDRQLFAYLLLSQHAELPRVTADMRHPVNVVRDVIAAGIGRRELRRGDPEVLAAMVMGLVLQVAQHRIYGRVRQRLDTLAPALVEAAWRVVSPDE